jgi:hypothetical protein
MKIKKWENFNEADSDDSYSKDFKYSLKSKDGKILLQTVVSFGTKNQPFPSTVDVTGQHIKK